LSPAEVVRLHASGVYDVYLLGFLPGFAFMGELPQVLTRPRRSEPRPARAGGQRRHGGGTLTAIYPWESPGGWHSDRRVSGAAVFGRLAAGGPAVARRPRRAWRPVDAAEYQALREEDRRRCARRRSRR
jgi:hypothetical protein